MEKNLKKMLKAMFYPLVLVRREYIKHRNVRWAEHHPMLLANYYYKNVMGHDINWSNPIDLNEKINWLKFKTDTSIWTTLADKYLVRNYIEEKGLGHLLPKLYGVWNNADDIDFEKLPNQFVLKTNHGCGTVILVKDKSTIDYASVRKQMNHWLTIRFGLETVEPHYLAIKPLITAEELLVPNGVICLIISYLWLMERLRLYWFVQREKSTWGVN